MFKSLQANGRLLPCLVLVPFSFAAQGIAADLTPSFSTAPTGWSTDRYAPASFNNIGAYNGENDVLALGINSAGGYGSRGNAYDYTFYNTQGDLYDIGSGGVGDEISVLVYIPTLWDTTTGPNERTDVWVDTKGQGDFGIIGFSNYGGASRFRVWDDPNNSWIDVSDPVLYGQWNSWTIKYTGDGFDYYINDVLSYSLSNAQTAGLPLESMFLEAYNFNGNDPNVTGAAGSDYTAYYADAPEPGTTALAGLGVLAVAWGMRRRSKRSPLGPVR